MAELQGKPIVITGASSGIGAATAIACARAGMPVGLFARREEKLVEIKERIERDGGKAIVMVGDVADPAASVELIAKAEEAFGDLYGAVANAGYGVESECATMEIDAIREIFEVNFYGSMHLVQPAIARFRERGAGHAMMVSSCLSKIGLPCYGAYCSTKAAQDYFCRAMRHELRGSGVHVSSVHPIGTKTELFEVLAEKSGGTQRLAGSSERFMQSPERVAKSIVKCLRRPKGEVWTSLPMRLGLGVGVMMPGVADWVLGRMVAKRTGTRH
jgi:short-subunit dehydrogenase